MDVNFFLLDLTGQWLGQYQLWLDPSQAPECSTTSMAVKPAAKGSYFLIHYDWVFQEAERAGVFLIGCKGDKAQASWGDSFHMQPMAMICEGGMDKGRLVLNGTYSAGDEQWGWRTEFATAHNQQLIMRAYNIAPSGHEDMALEASYGRAEE